MPTENSYSAKIYYTIGEVSEILGENASLIRFWGEKFPSFIKPVRNKKGNRLFTRKDVDNLKIIHHFVKDLGMTLEGAQRRMKENISGEDKKLEVIAKLRSIKKLLLDISQGKVAEEPDEEAITTNIPATDEIADNATNEAVADEKIGHVVRKSREDEQDLLFLDFPE